MAKRKATPKKKPSTKLLGKGMAAQAGKTLKKAAKTKKKRLADIMSQM